MTKKLIVLSLLIFSVVGYVSAQLPYSKMMELSDGELKEKKFKYDKNKNSYMLSKTNGLNGAVNILNAISSNGDEYKPHEDDYIVTVQKGEASKTSYVHVTFYKDETYHMIRDWANENDIRMHHSYSVKLTVSKFEYEGMRIELKKEPVYMTKVSKNSGSLKSVDNSYNKYSYTIYTGIPAASKWHTKQAEKKAKKKLKGGKQDINDLM